MSCRSLLGSNHGTDLISVKFSNSLWQAQETDKFNGANVIKIRQAVPKLRKA